MDRILSSAFWDERKRQISCCGNYFYFFSGKYYVIHREVVYSMATALSFWDKNSKYIKSSNWSIAHGNLIVLHNKYFDAS